MRGLGTEHPTATPGASATPARQSRRWLLERYWFFAWAVLLASLPLYALWGRPPDLVGIGCFVAITVTAWLVSRRSAAVGALLHLLVMIPFWAWYIRLPGALPHLLHAGVAEYVILLVFPMLTLVTVENLRGGVAGVALGGGGLMWRWQELEPRVEGLFLLGTAVLIGLVFRRLARELDGAHERMRHMAFHDDLTGLANRRELQQVARSWLAQNSVGALLFVDLDRFKTVNDVLGHSAGDEVLALLAVRLRRRVPAPHLLARIGGDEFAVLLPGLDEEAAVAKAHELLEALSEPCSVRGKVVHVGASIGVALWPEHGRELESLMKGADVAMFRAKKQDVPIAVHQSEQDSGTLTSRGLEVDLYRAIDSDELRLEYQPVQDLTTGAIVGAEALVRWRHPERGTIPPSSFIELAEETGHIHAIDQWVLRHALAQLRDFDGHGFEGWLAINISVRSLEDPSFVQELELALADEGIAAGRLVVELTESAAMMDPETSSARLEQLSRLGVKIALDDFGMGYSSLAYLKRFPASHVKLDRSFTRGIGQHARDEEVIELVLQLADKLKMDVVAEGVEEPGQSEWLARHGCRLAQGYGIARPMGPAEFVARTLGIDGANDFARPSQRSESGVRKRRIRARRSIIPRRTA